MATTKKVAATSRGAKQVKPAVVASLRSKAVKKTPKQVLKTKKVSSRSASVKIKNNTVKKSEVKNKLDTKLQKVEAFHTKKVPELTSKKDKTVPKESRFKKFRPTLELALLSPYRFPIDTERLAVGAARYGGVFFVLLGAFFSLFYATNSFSGQQSQTALLSNIYETNLNLTVPTICDNSGPGSCPSVTTYEQKPPA
jgi:hypothetical protein